MLKYVRPMQGNPHPQNRLVTYSTSIPCGFVFSTTSLFAFKLMPNWTGLLRWFNYYNSINSNFNSFVARWFTLTSFVLCFGEMQHLFSVMVWYQNLGSDIRTLGGWQLKYFWFVTRGGDFHGVFFGPGCLFDRDTQYSGWWFQRFF